MSNCPFPVCQGIGAPMCVRCQHQGLLALICSHLQWAICSQYRRRNDLFQLTIAEDVEKAAKLLATRVLKTPVIELPGLSQIASYGLATSSAEGKAASINLFVKCEHLQYTGSFKFRGASHFIASLGDDELTRGVVAHSTGEAKPIYSFASY